MRRFAVTFGALLFLTLLAGCVERRMLITTEPFGAVVYNEKGAPVGATPADRPFTYYGKYRFTVVKDGYETLVQDIDVKAPWYEWAGLDFISENIIPWNIRDIRRIHFQLQPARVIPPEQVLQQAIPLAERGRVTGPPHVDGPPPPLRGPETMILGNPIAAPIQQTPYVPVPNSPPGVAPAGVVPPSGVAPYGVAPSGVAPSGVAPSGVAPSGVAPSGVAPAPTVLPVPTGNGLFSPSVPGQFPAAPQRQP